MTIEKSDEIILPRVHAAIMGESGAGKSRLASQFPKPMLVLQTDPIGNEQEYLERGELDPQEYTGEQEQPIMLVKSRVDGRTIIQIEQYHDAIPEAPRAFTQLLSRSASIPADIAAGKWKTVVLDGYTFFDYLARKRRQYDRGFMPADGKVNVWSTADVEEFVFGRMAGWRCNVLLLCHIDEDKDEQHGTFIRNPKAPGKMRKGTSGAFQELYRVYVDGVDEAGRPKYRIQTQPDGRFNCKTRIAAPDNVEPSYKGLFLNYVAKQRQLREKSASSQESSAPVDGPAATA